MFAAEMVGMVLIVAIVFGFTWGEDKDDYY